MSNLLQVSPKKNVQVRKEDGGVIPKEGCSVPNNRYYRQRIKDGDLLLVNAAATSEKSVAKAKSTKDEK